MRTLISLALAALLISPLAQARDIQRELQDRVDIQDVMAKYIWTVDSLDADGYVSVFTDDAVIDSNGTLIKGHEEIRKVVTGQIEKNADNKAKGLPPVRMYHIVCNTRVSFTGKDEAVFQSYWQTVRRKDNLMVAGGMGRSEDHLVRSHGQWLIKFRKLTVFTE
jgi:hypothetical protein